MAQHKNAAMNLRSAPRRGVTYVPRRSSEGAPRVGCTEHSVYVPSTRRENCGPVYLDCQREKAGALARDCEPEGAPIAALRPEQGYFTHE
jgi:hypothetical protein